MGILKKRGSALALMRSKRKFSLLILLTLFLLMVPLASADLGTPGTDYNSRWAYSAPTIDGTISPGEWANATVRDFTLEMRSYIDGSLNKTLNATLLIKNDYTNIYAAIQVFNDDYEAMDFKNRYDSCALLFDNNHNHIVEVGENGEGGQTWNGSSFYLNNDLYYAGGSYWDYDTHVVGNHNDGAMNWSHTNPIQGNIGNWTFEMRIPLVGQDAGYDLAITTLPKTVGYKIWFSEPAKGTDGVYPDNSTILTNFDETYDGNTFGNLILHPLYTLTIQAGPNGTTDPAPSPPVYYHGYGEVVPVEAKPDFGYELDHWELTPGGNVGSTNPYSVTMDKDYILKAFFRLKPTPTVGGMAAPIVIPINEPNLLTPLIWLASAIIFPIALTVVFVKLKKKKL